MHLWLAYLLILRVWASEAREIPPRGTFQFTSTVIGSFQVEHMIGSRFVEECLERCIEFGPSCKAAWFIEEDWRCNMGFVLPGCMPMTGNFWIRMK